MLRNERYIKFCKIFHNHNFPKLKFKELNDRYKAIYEIEYDINENDINKASFLLFSLTFFSIFLVSIFFTKFTLLFIILYSFIFSLIISYKFNLHLFNVIEKMGAKLNVHLYLIKIYYSLIQNSLKNDSDYSLNFIKLISEYEFGISEDFKNIIKRIQEGAIPEEQLSKLITVSDDFNNYVKELILFNFENDHLTNEFDKNSLEKNFKIYLKQIESKLSIIFFICLFYPLGSSFLMLFHKFDSLFSILLIPVLFLILHFLFKKFIKFDHYLIGLLNDYSKLERKKFNEFLLLLRNFALNLKQNLSPEKSFINSYSQCKSQISLLSKIVHKHTLRILNFTCSFEEMLDFLKIDLKSIRYDLILDIIKRIIKQDAYDSSLKILEILKILNQHRKLEKKLELILKGEKFKILFFLFLLPIVIGVIGGIFPFFSFLIDNIDLNNSFEYIYQINFNLTKDMFFLFISLLGCINLSSHYFLKVINLERRLFLILIANTLYILIFFMTYLMVITFF